MGLKSAGSTEVALGRVSAVVSERTTVLKSEDSDSESEGVREYTAQIPFPESSPHLQLTWRQEEENHGVSERLLAAGALTAAQ